MAGLNLTTPQLSPRTRGQLAAIARVRWHLFVNSLRTTRGHLELVSRVVIALTFAAGGVGGACGFGAGAWFFISRGKVEWLTLLLWPIFLFWQMFPVMASAFTENVDSSHLLRFPLGYRSYFLVRLVYGAFEPATLLGSLWLLGILIGIGVANLALLPWAALVLITFCVVNILMARMVFAWVERWLAQRRTREILGIFFVLLLMCFQLIGPMLNRYGRRSHAQLQFAGRELSPVQRILPPGLAANAIGGAFWGISREGFVSFGLLGAYGLVILWTLHVRLIAQYRGENLSESTATVAGEKNQALRRGWRIGGISGVTVALFEKELRYLSRSGPMLLTFITPLFMLLIFRNSGPNGGTFVRRPALMFPIGAAYSLLLLTNLIYNNFGGDGSGIQFFFTLPVRLRNVVFAKNLAHMVVFATEMILVWVAVSLLFRPPTPEITTATLAGVLFAALVNLAAGNLLSIYAPKRIEHGTLGRQRASQTTVLASFGIQLSIFAIGAATFMLGRTFGMLWLATAVFALLAGLGLASYALVLRRVDEIPAARREALVAEISRM